MTKGMKVVVVPLECGGGDGGARGREDSRGAHRPPGTTITILTPLATYDAKGTDGDVDGGGGGLFTFC